jgi:small-conductance mechanosensitive channel
MVERILVRAWLAVVAGAALSPDALAQAASPDQAALQYLNQTVDWYRDLNALDAAALRAEEVLFRESVSRTSRQALNVAFDFARAEADRLFLQEITGGPATAPGRNGGGNRPADSARERMARAAAAARQRVEQLRAEREQVERDLAGTTAASRPALVGRRDSLNAELDLATARSDALERLTGFSTGREGNGDASPSASMLDKIEALQRSVPDAQRDAPAASAAATQPVASAVTAAVAQQQAFRRESAGVFQLLGEMFSLSSRMSELKGLADRAESLKQANDKLRQPLRNQIMEAMRRGDALAATRPADDPAQQDARRRELHALASRFRELSGVALPLGQQTLALDATRTNLLEWRGALGREYGSVLRRLLVRLTISAIAIAVVVGISVLWRRATFRYVQDVRRRRQLMLVRRIVITLVILLVALFSLVTEFGSLATFAGILTAGIAVSLQTLILSGVAYFFFIGRYGVRVGDRVTVGAVTGDVVETGLFRLYLMELAGPRHQRPTGRIVVFSNSVLFQPAGFFKQIPGSEYTWHEVALTLSPDTDHGLAEKRLREAVDAVVSGYRESIDHQYRVVSRTSPVPVDPPRTESRLRFVDAGLEIVIRYPVETRRSADADDEVTRRLLAAIEQEPKLRMVATGTPKIQAGAGT